eukprot:562118-Pyramimonas_sp.AAC.1
MPEDEVQAHDDLRFIEGRLGMQRHRRYSPPWSWPQEITQVILRPRALTKPGLPTTGIGCEGGQYIIHGLGWDGDDPPRRPDQ